MERMNDMKKLIAALLVLAMALTMGGCLRKADGTLTAAAENMEKCNSLSYRMRIDMEGEKDGKSVPLQVEAVSRIMEQEGLMHMSLHMNLAEIPVQMEIYRQQEGFNSTEYRGTNWGDGMEWVRTEGSVLSIASAVPSEDFLKYISEVEKTEDTLVINGRSCTRYEGAVKGPNLKLLLKLVSLLGDVGSEISQNLQASLDTLRIPVTLYLDTQENRIIRISVDALELLSASGILEEEMSQCKKMEFSIEYGDFDAVTDIVIPEEALNAPFEKDN